MLQDMIEILLDALLVAVAGALCLSVVMAPVVAGALT